MQDVIDILNKAKQNAIEAIIGSDLSKLRKLMTIEEHKLFEPESYIFHAFPEEWKDELQEIVRQNAEKKGVDSQGRPAYVSTISDDLFDGDGFERHELVSICDLIVSAAEGASYDQNIDLPVDWFDSDDVPEVMIAVLESRDGVSVLYKPLKDVIDVVYDVCIASKTVEYYLDW